MEIYLVGGAVRDKAMGITPKDLDYVVVGSSPEELLALGYKPVGSDFPVFLHPETKHEYALARTEKKDGTGYSGFSCYFGKEVTLEEDLKRRDLTINSMAEDLEGNIIDPFGGLQDIGDKVIRHTSDAFLDDPVRALRAFRFLARFGPEWSLDLTTHTMVNCLIAGQFKDLKAERVWLEVKKVLMDKHPEIFFNYLSLSGSATEWFKEFQALAYIPQPTKHHPEIWTGLHTEMCLQQGVKLGLLPSELFAILCHDFGKAATFQKNGNLIGHEEEGVELVEAFCDRLKVPTSYKKLAIQVCKYHTHCHRALEMKATTIYKLFQNLGAFQQPQNLVDFVKCCEADARGRTGFENRDYPQGLYLIRCLVAAMSIPKKFTVDLLEKGVSGISLGDRVRQERIRKIKEVM